MTTYSVRACDIRREWRLVDVSGKTLGRVATEIAGMLKGKDKPIYCTHMDVGDFVVVINAAKVRVTGKKAKGKVYYRHTLYPGGLRATTFGEMLETHPARVIEHAVKGMIPHTRQGRGMLRRLKVYAGDVHPHQVAVEAQRRG